jgi:phosphoribosyl 1,2-cyclic phosphodiesterase
MIFRTFSSGSKGNSSIVICGNIVLLIDAGISFLSLKESMKNLNKKVDDITGILITHCHKDHTKGLATILKNTSLKVLIPDKMYDELKDIVPKNRVIFIKDNNKLLDVSIKLIHTSHDVNCSVGYIIEYLDKSLVYITDTGYLSKKVLNSITNKNIYLIESNHDEEMLMNGPYPPFLKQRVISDKGHLSNRATSEYLKEVVGKDTKYILLAHLSEKNNTEELAFNSSKEVLKNKKVELMIARQDEESSLIEV